ncbi:FixH family protein [Jeotgalibacillus haloalkalitolerans]|uniref:FixH family protein n=1 Tax=Jeotgalibacillus haloalkalitolerans TaxID=3104292 RepID=A0ABU5KJY3_9BACL|nr:FixH family protein [Jeotgalibacillus sp. HH7-29]MDZ5711030.1 FixH family protein [Jeotgalibacillus sp. HH7-29]
MNKRIGALTLAGAILLSGCAAGNPEARLSEPLETFIYLPEDISADTPETFTVHVTENGELLETADDITFEVWQEAAEESEWIEAESSEAGVYTAEATFEKEGLYYIQAHVSSDGVSSMPVKSFTVGELTEEEQAIVEEEPEEHDEGHHH